jgi:anti-sigma regulatory factor (Ser/Thr protein kinase)
MTSIDQRTFPARLAALPDTAIFAREFCHRRGLGSHDALRLTLVLEELFTNTVRHGYRNESDSPIRIGLSLDEGRIALLYEDSAPAYDPLALLSKPPSSLTAPVEERPIGGLGIHLVGQLAAGGRYAFEDGRNRLWLTMSQQD